ncbi:hypothetical protein [Sphingomonas sp. LHG3443-2]|uniref:hypothetical protein n=1 Tax=Sphingomonas sp. LHG3443-2 TaxID=2804639 RepID=UPI003CF3F025
MRCPSLLQALAGASLLPLAAVAPAQEQASGQPESRPAETYLDLQAGLGFSTNPELRLNGRSSGFGRISAYGFHGWSTERSASSVSAYVENTSYFRQLGNRQLLSLEANNTTQVSEKARVFGNLGFSADYGNQLSSRFFSAPGYTIPADPVIPETSVIVVSPDLVALSQRQYRVFGRGGASFVISPRDSLNVSIGAQRAWFKGGATVGSDLLDYNLYDTSVAWRRQVNERLSAGVRFSGSRSDYTQGRAITSYGPQLTADLQLDEQTQLGGAIGFVRTERNYGAPGIDRTSTDLAFDASICRDLEYERFCGRVARRTQSAAIGTAPTTSSLVADYSRRLSARDQVQASVSFVTTEGVAEFETGRQNFYSVAGSFDRKISPRLSAGVNLAARRYTFAGPDPKTDIGGSLFIRNRFGSVR